MVHNGYLPVKNRPENFLQSSPVLAMKVGTGLRRAVAFLKKGEPIQYRRTETHAHGFFPHTHFCHLVGKKSNRRHEGGLLSLFFWKLGEL